MPSYLEGRDAANLPDAPTYLAELDADLRGRFAALAVAYPGLAAILTRPEHRATRVELTRLDPLLFAIVYCAHIVTNKFGKITFGDMHLAMCRHAATWALPLEAERGPRDVFVGSRGYGKSAWLMRILPLWAAAHGHSSKAEGRGPFILLLSATHDAVSNHVGDLVEELRSNVNLGLDFPELAKEVKIPRAKYASADGTMIVATSVESKLRGLNLRNRRPDIIVADDIDVDAASDVQITAITDALSRKVDLLAEDARIVIAGTTTVYRGVIHQLLMPLFDGWKGTPKDVREWVRDWSRHYFEPLVAVNDTFGGEVYERSTWPGRWSAEHIQRVRKLKPKTYELEWLNRPAPATGTWWARADYLRIEDFDFVPFEVGIFVDPASIDKKSSDATAIILAAWNGDTGPGQKVAIIHAEEHRGLVGKALDEKLCAVVGMYRGTAWEPSFGAVDITNGGGNLLAAVATFGMLVPVFGVQYKTTAKLAGPEERDYRGKGQRIVRSAMHYRMRRVLHGDVPALENQQTSWSGDESIPLDDVVDDGALAVLWWLDPDWVRPPEDTGLQYASGF